MGTGWATGRKKKPKALDTATTPRSEVVAYPAATSPMAAPEAAATERDVEVSLGVPTLVITECAPRKNVAGQPATSGSSTPTFTKADIQQLVSTDPQRRVLIVHGLVCDVTEFAPIHPGGSAVFEENNGKDATQAFDSVHGAHVKDKLKQWVIGRFATAPPSGDAGSTTSQSEAPATTELTMEGIRSKIAANRGTCLLILFGDVYDVSSYAASHPGGTRVLHNHNGKECGDTFMRIHGLRARELVRQFYIGRLCGSKYTQSPLRTAPGAAKTGASTAATSSHRQAKSTRILELTPSATSPSIRYFTFSTPHPLRLIPGGHIKLYSNLDQDEGRFYTPYRTEVASFTICMKRYPDGVNSGYFFSLEEGAEVSFEGPFPPTWRAADDSLLMRPELTPATRNVLLLAGGTGTAPLYSIARDLLLKQTAHVHLICAFQSHEDEVLEEELKELAQRYSAENDSPTHATLVCHMRGFCVLTRAPPGAMVSWARKTFTGIVNAAVIQECCTAPIQAVVVCGPPGFNEAVVKNCTDAKVAEKQQIHVL